MASLEGGSRPTFHGSLDGRLGRWAGPSPRSSSRAASGSRPSTWKTSGLERASCSERDGGCTEYCMNQESA